jgi:hypothetical protein
MKVFHATSKIVLPNAHIIFIKTVTNVLTKSNIPPSFPYFLTQSITLLIENTAAEKNVKNMIKPRKL